MKTLSFSKKRSGTKNKWNVFLAFVLLFILTPNLKAQFQLNTVPPLNGGTASAGITFNVTAHQILEIDTIYVSFNLPAKVDVWYRQSPINGLPTIDSSHGWVQLVKDDPIKNPVGKGKIQPIPAKIGLIIPAGYTYGFYLGGPNMSLTNAPTGVALPYSDTNMTIECGNKVGFGGYVPRPWDLMQFNGGIKYTIISGNNNASVLSLDSPNVFCKRTQNIVATIGNYGHNPIDSVWVNWEINGVSQTPIQYSHKLDTLGGLQSNKAQISLGRYNFQKPTNIKVYTSMPNGVADSSNYNDTLELTVGPSLIGTYTVDSSLVASKTNFTDISSMVASLKKYGVCGPTTINIANEVYHEPLYLESIPGASSNNYVLIDGGDSTKTIFTSDGKTNYATLTFDGVKYLKVKNMTFKMTGTSGIAVIFTNDAEYDTLSNCATWVNVSSTSANVNNLAFSGSPNSYSAKKAKVNHVVVQNNRMIGGYYGIRAYGETSDLNTYNQFLNNVIDSVYYYGAFFNYQDSIEFIGNSVNVLNSTNSKANGINIFNSNNTIFSQNYIWAKDAAASFFNNKTYSPINRRYKICNNMLYSESNHGLGLSSVISADIWHNTVNVEGSSIEAVLISSSPFTVLNYDMRNNIFRSKNAGALYTITSDTKIFNKCDNNIYYTADSSNLLVIAGVKYKTLAAYQTAQPLFNSNSIQADPIFNSPTDLHPRGLVANEAGDSSVGITVDIDGDIRPSPGATIVDIGADEFMESTCPPLTAVIQSVSINSATVLYQSTTFNSTKEYILVSCGTSRSSGIIMTTNADSVLLLSGLYSKTCYDLYIREVCSTNDTSNWAGPFGFYTSYELPFFENFESFDSIVYNPWPKGWISSTTLQTRWEGHSGNLIFQYTGPSVDHTLGTASGTYLYFKSASGLNSDSADFISPTISVSKNQRSIQLSFWYYFYGAGINEMNVIIDTNGVETIVATIIGGQQNSKNEPWLKDSIFLRGYQGKAIKIKFRGRKGSSISGNMAIDDVEVIAAVPYYPIGKLNTEDANGVADSLNVDAWVFGTVVGVDLNVGNGLDFILIDMSSNSQEGIYIHSDSAVSNYIVTEGDSLKVRGTVDQFNGLTQFVVDSIEIISRGNTIPTARLVTTLDESTESQRLEMKSFVLLDSSSIGSYNMLATNGTDTISIQVDALTDVSDSLVNIKNSLVPKDTICAIIGIGGQFDPTSPYTEGYQITPMYYSDLTICRFSTGLRTQKGTTHSFSFYPNPTIGEFTIVTDGLENDNAILIVRDISGKVVLRENIANSSKAFLKTYNLSRYAKGLYLISILDGEKQINKKLILK